MDNNLIKFLNELENSYKEDSFKRIVISKSKDKNLIKRIEIRIIEVKGEELFSFTYIHPTKHVVKNYKLEEMKKNLLQLLGVSFKNVILFTEEKDIHLIYNKKMVSTLYYNKATCNKCIPKNHNREKKRMISIENNLYLKELGITTKEGNLIQNMGDKYRQINKFLETIKPIVESISQKSIKIVDMGSGKGYLTFSTYDFIYNTLKKNCCITGVEIRKELVDYCNTIAKKCNFSNLNFESNTIQEFKMNNIDVLIALHACDTATDDAIYKGITNSASAIIVAPCCHKQIRKEFHVKNNLKYITKHGILKERLAESVTDSLRSIILEIFAYKTQIFEFISDEHTHKNVMIVGIKKNVNNKKRKEKIIALYQLKETFGIKSFYLENLLKNKIHEIKI